ncbi:MAG: hypothetical protein KTR25_07255 [Myxococcales bacterium]|nr:hypothetical protein [Myxococcales bacterium]
MNIRRYQWHGLAVVLSLCVGIEVFAQTTPALSESSLSPQEQKMLGLARIFAKRCQRAIEDWVKNGEVSEAKLFSRLYYPIPGTSPPKFSTDWDNLADRDIRHISDDILSKSAAISFAVLVDVNGYLPAHNRRYSLPLTGDPAVDLVRNRTKRMFADRTGLAAAQSTTRFLLQHYSRDTGELMVDLSVPVYVNNRKWGAARIGFRVVNESQ